MPSRPFLLLSLLFVALLPTLPSCGGGPSSASEKFEAAARALDEGDADRALELLREIQRGEVEGEASEADRFRAALEEAKALVTAGRAKEGLERFSRLYEEFPAEMSSPTAHKHANALLSTMDRAGAPVDVMIDLLALAREKHAEHADKFAAMVEALKKHGLTSEQQKRLQSLGYLGG